MSKKPISRMAAIAAVAESKRLQSLYAKHAEIDQNLFHVSALTGRDFEELREAFTEYAPTSTTEPVRLSQICLSRALYGAKMPWDE